MKRIIKLNKKGEIIKLIEKIFIDPSFFGAKFYFSNLMCIVNQGVYCEDCARSVRGTHTGIAPLPRVPLELSSPE